MFACTQSLHKWPTTVSIYTCALLVCVASGWPPVVSLVNTQPVQLAAVSLSQAELTDQVSAWRAASPYISGFGNLAAFATKLLVEWQPTLWICSSLLTLTQRQSKEWLCRKHVTQEKQQLASKD